MAATQKSKYPHIEWIDLQNNNILVECAVMKRDQLGNTYFVRLDAMDNIDKKRLFKIVTNRNAELYELWDLMSNVTLGNGVNALTYFHQLTKVVTPNGQVMPLSSSVIGVSGTRKVSGAEATPTKGAEGTASAEGTQESAE